jgi:hypothetical protein
MQKFQSECESFVNVESMNIITHSPTFWIGREFFTAKLYRRAQENFTLKHNLSFIAKNAF